MYIRVKELNAQQLEQLKMKVFYDLDSADDFLLDHLADELSFEEYKILETADCWTEIPNEIIYKLYEDISFVEEDFACDNEEETKPIKNYSYNLWNDILEIYIVDMNDNELLLATLCECENMEDYKLNNLALETIQNMGYELKGE